MDVKMKVIYFDEEFFCNSVYGRSFDLPKEQRKIFHVLIHNQEGLTLGVTLDELKKSLTE
jgi:hypothetical protein